MLGGAVGSLGGYTLSDLVDRWLSEGSFLDRGEDFVEEVGDGFGVGDQEHVAAFWDDMGWGGEADGENLVAAAVDMVEGLRNGVVPPFQDRAQGPADEPVIARANHLSH